MKPNLERMRKLMTANGMDAVIAFDVENFYYLSGAFSVFLLGLQPAGMGMVMIPRDENKEPAIITNDMEGHVVTSRSWIKDVRLFPTWMSIIEPSAPLASPIDKPCQIDYEYNFRLLAKVISERGMERAKIGISFDFVQVNKFVILQKVLPHIEFVDATMLFQELRAIKRPEEVSHLKRAAQVAERAMLSAAALIREGVTQRELVDRMKYSIIGDPEADNYKFVSASIGPYAIAPSSTAREAKARRGDIIKIDSGAECNGYISDMGRTYVVGKAAEEVQRIYDSIRRAHDACEALLRPGVSIREVYLKGMKIMREGAVPTYSRGHIGHSIGLGITPEEPPFISPYEERPLRPGMVLCLEVPVYISGLGALHIENTYVITEEGHENFIKTSKELKSMGAVS